MASWLSRYVFLAACATCAAAVAIPASGSPPPAAFEATSDALQSINSTSLPVLLQSDDIIVIRTDGGVTIMKEYEFDSLVRRRDELYREQEEEFLRSHNVTEPYPQADELSKRDCEQSTELKVMGSSDFLDWDVPMSGIIKATGAPVGPQNTVAVTAGFQVANALTLGASVTPTIIRNILSASFSVQVSRTWTSSYTAAYTFAVTNQYYGLVVSNPWTHRIWGYTLSGCTGSWTSESFQSDSHTSQSFDSLSWVQGVIKLCESPTYPVPFCTGTGSHH